MEQNNSPCPHYELMQEYIKDCASSTEPWLLWEINLYPDSECDWLQLMGHPTWYPSAHYRRKLRTITINGVEVPEPMRSAPEVNSMFWVVALRQPNLVREYIYDGGTQDVLWLRRGLVHTTKEAALAHAHALLSLSMPNE